jgi:GDP-4-dehydro-6-deoxy-D-mannose reductase
MRGVLRTLITGYSGFAGGHLADHLLAETDWEVWGTVYPPGHVPRTSARVHERVADLRDVLMQINLHRAIAEHAADARVVVIVSNEVYGAPPLEQLPLDELQPMSPLNPYAASKAAQDMLAEIYGRAQDADVIRVRPFTHIGPGQDDRFVAASFARQVAEIEAGVRAPVIRVGNLDAERDFTDVRDTVRGYRLAAEVGEASSVYNLGTGQAHAVREILEHYVASASVDVTIEADPDRMRPSDVPRTLCDAGKARRDLGWAPLIAFERTLDDILDWWRARVGEQSVAGT